MHANGVADFNQPLRSLTKFVDPYLLNHFVC
jgi:hypothetical protein